MSGADTRRRRTSRSRWASRMLRRVRWLWSLLVLTGCNAILDLEPRSARPPPDPAPRCGDGLRAATEACDGEELGGATCTSALGVASRGRLACTDACALDTRACCGDLVRGAGEQCDGPDLGGASCTLLFGPDASGRVRCADDCSLDTTGCCGDGVRGEGEACDGRDLGGQSCTSLLGAGVSGALGCTSRCALDTSRCCGDGTRTASEACDGEDLAGQTCVSLGHDLGTLGCTACTLDEASCVDCTPDQRVCDGACVDLDTDRAHCGGCGRSCAAGEVCAVGHCTSREWALWDVTRGPDVEVRGATVFDHTTSLLWQRSIDANPCRRKFAQCTLDEASAYCEDLQLDGFDDWRLPTRIELLSLIVDTATVGPTLPVGPQGFDRFGADNFYWTSSRHPWALTGGVPRGFIVYFGHPRNVTDVAGGATRQGQPGGAGSARVRCVRAGVGS